MGPNPGEDDALERARGQRAERAAVGAAERVVPLHPERSAVHNPDESLDREGPVRQPYDDYPPRGGGPASYDEQLVAVAQGRGHRRPLDEHPADGETHGDSVASYRFLIDTWRTQVAPAAAAPHRRLRAL